jgi:hypothetical protein
LAGANPTIVWYSENLVLRFYVVAERQIVERQIVERQIVERQIVERQIVE